MNVIKQSRVGEIIKNVIRNKVLLRHIMRMVRVVHLDLRVPSFRYEEITSVKWIVTNKYIDLLYYKARRSADQLEYGHRGYIALVNTMRDVQLFAKLYDLQRDRIVHAADQLIDNAAVVGNIDIIKYLLEKKDGDGNRIYHPTDSIDRASNYKIEKDALETIKYLHQHCNKYKGIATTLSFELACARGHLEIVKFLNQHRTEGCTESAIDVAAAHNNLSIVRYLFENRSEGCSELAVEHAASKGYTEVVEYLLDTVKANWTHLAIRRAALMGHLETVRSLLDRQCYFNNDTDIVDCAASTSNPTLIKLLLDRGLRGSHVAIDVAAEKGSLDIIQQLVNVKGHLCTTLAIDKAAENGHLEIIKLLATTRTEGCTNKALSKAADNNHLEVVQYLVATYSELEIRPKSVLAMCKGSITLETFKYCFENGLIDKDGCQLFDLLTATAQSDQDNLELFMYICQINSMFVPNTMTLDVAASAGNMKIIRYLIEEKQVKITSKSVRSACARGDLQLTKYLVEDRQYTIDSQCMELAVKENHTHVVEYLLDRCPQQVTHHVYQYAAELNNEHIIQLFLDHPLTSRPHISSLSHCDSVRVFKLLLNHCNVKTSTDVSSGRLEYLQGCQRVGDYTFVNLLPSWLGPHSSLVLDRWLVRQCVQNGALEMLRSIPPNPEAAKTESLVDALEMASMYGNVEYIKHLVDVMGAKVSPRSVVLAATTGHLSSLVTLLNRTTLESIHPAQFDTLFVSAAAKGRVTVIQHLVSIDQFSTTSYLTQHVLLSSIVRASQGGYIQMVLYLLEQFNKLYPTIQPTPEKSIIIKAGDGQIRSLSILKLLDRDGLSIIVGHDTLESVIEDGDLSMLQYINESPRYNHLIQSTSVYKLLSLASNHLPVFRYLAETAISNRWQTHANHLFLPLNKSDHSPLLQATLHSNKSVVRYILHHLSPLHHRQSIQYCTVARNATPEIIKLLNDYLNKNKK